MDISGWLPVLWFLLCFVGCLNLSYVIFDYYKSKPILMSTILDKINCDIIVLYTFGQSSQILALSLKETVPAVNTWVALFLSWGLQFTFQSVPLYLSLGVLLRYCQVKRWKTVFFETFSDEIVAMMIRVFVGIFSTSLCFAIFFTKSSGEGNFMYLYLTGTPLLGDQEVPMNDCLITVLNSFALATNVILRALLFLQNKNDGTGHSSRAIILQEFHKAKESAKEQGLVNFLIGCMFVMGPTIIIYFLWNEFQTVVQARMVYSFLFSNGGPFLVIMCNDSMRRHAGKIVSDYTQAIEDKVVRTKCRYQCWLSNSVAPMTSPSRREDGANNGGGGEHNNRVMA